MSLDDIFNHSYINGVKIFDGIVNENIEEYKTRIEFYKKKAILVHLTPMETSTITVLGKLAIQKFMEEDLIKLLPKPTGPSILGIECNYQRMYNDNYTRIIKVKKNKEPSKRKKQGSGDCFNSQITFIVRHELTDYKIKLFRLGTLHIPGTTSPTLHDAIPPLKILVSYLKEIPHFKDIKIEYLKPIMRNYNTIIMNEKNTNLDIDELYNIFNQYKNNGISLLKQHLPSNICTYLLKDKCFYNYNLINIAETTLRSDKGYTLTIKFDRPIIDMNCKDVPLDELEDDEELDDEEEEPPVEQKSHNTIIEYDLPELEDKKIVFKKDKKITIKAHKSGRININGCTNELEAQELYYWLNYIIDQNPHVLISRNDVLCNDSETEDSDYDSIYDE